MTPNNPKTFSELFSNPNKVMIMSIINLSPESFFKGSIKKGDEDDFLDSLINAQKNGATLLDLGAMSTAPYLDTEISEEEETERLASALRKIPKDQIPYISIDTSRRQPAEYSLRQGVSIINDVHGFERDQDLLKLAKDYEANVILMANESQLEPGKISKNQSPERIVFSCLKRIRDRALDHGIDKERIVLDPGVGFFRNQNVPWFEFDLQLIRSLPLFRELGHPLLVSVSRKSFLGELLGRKDAKDRLPGSLASTYSALQQGAQIIRAHDVSETQDVVKYYQKFQEM